MPYTETHKEQELYQRQGCAARSNSHSGSSVSYTGAKAMSMKCHI